MTRSYRPLHSQSFIVSENFRFFTVLQRLVSRVLMTMVIKETGRWHISLRNTYARSRKTEICEEEGEEKKGESKVDKGINRYKEDKISNIIFIDKYTREIYNDIWESNMN